MDHVGWTDQGKQINKWDSVARRYIQRIRFAISPNKHPVYSREKKVDPKSMLRDNVTPVMQRSKIIMVERWMDLSAKEGCQYNHCALGV